MKKLIFFSLLLISSCYVSKSPSRKQAKMLRLGKLIEDTSHVYELPFEKGSRHFVVQGYYSLFSHRERAALDFKMKEGTPVCAARSGRVLRVKEDSRIGGWNKKYRPHGNHIVIEHADGSRAGYWHLEHNGALVEVGDSVTQGQVIGKSGKTGYTALAHLHFIVWRHAGSGKWQQVATKFRTGKGVRYLKGWKEYKRPEQ